MYTALTVISRMENIINVIRRFITFVWDILKDQEAKKYKYSGITFYFAKIIYLIISYRCQSFLGKNVKFSTLFNKRNSVDQFCFNLPICTQTGFNGDILNILSILTCSAQVFLRGFRNDARSN